VFAAVIFLITAGAIYISTAETVFNLKRLHDLAGASHIVVRVRSDGSQEEVDGTQLVPGDCFIVPEGGVVPCDGLLITGRVSVDESMLTGESVPVTKTPIEADLIQTTSDLERKTGNILYSGTKVILCTGGSGADAACMAVAYRTGFRSAKGQLIAALLNPKDAALGFFSDALWIIFMMFIICTLLYVWSGTSLHRAGLTLGRNVFYYFTNITIAVPPTLTASLSVATAISIERLAKLGIFVSESSRVNWAGLINAVCFDKTGTLTEERLHMKGLCIPNTVLDPTADSISSSSSCELNADDPHSAPMPSLCIELLASCHGLALIKSEPVGDPLEVELFRASGYVMASANKVSPGEANKAHTISKQQPINGEAKELAVLRQFEFSADKLRAGSLVRRQDSGSSKPLVYYVKGSPEAIMSLALPSTLPAGINKDLEGLSRRGLRIIAMAYVEFDESDLDRVMTASQLDLESHVAFLGLVFLSNALKEDTVRTIAGLQRADIAANMITGDHIYTAIAIAGDCGLITTVDTPIYIIDSDPNITESKLQISTFEDGEILPLTLDQLMTRARDVHKEVHTHSGLPRRSSTGKPPTCQVAITGRGLDTVKAFYASSIPDIVLYTRVFARMKPADKQYIVEELLKLDEEPPMTDNDEALATSSSSASSVVSSAGLIHSCMHHERDVEAGDQTDDQVALAPKPASSWVQTLLSCGGVVSDGRGLNRVMFCGDGANDMAALRAATVGVSLCEGETSVAAPITSRLQTPGAVIDTIREGRCSLITAYVLVCFTLEYAMIQLFMACNMYSYGLKIGDYTYLIHDLLFTLVLALIISRTPPSDTLGPSRPPQRFFTRHFLFKLFSQMICFPIFQLIALEALSRCSWYEKYDADQDKPLSETYATENSAIAFVGLVQVMISSVVSTVGEPYRKAWYTNYPHVACLLLQTVFVIGQLFASHNPFTSDFLEIKPMNRNFCGVLVVIMIANTAVSLALEKIGQFLH
jgi:magnesium-transporting ATPase (P-type)